MRKIAAIMIALATLAIATPTTTANEQITREYTGSAGFYNGPMPRHPLAGTCVTEGLPCVPSGRGLALVLCSNTCGIDVDEDGTRDIEYGPIGGAGFTTEGFYSNAIFRPSDEVYGTGAAISACMWDPDGDNICDPNPGDGDIDYQSDWTCGTVSLLGAGVATNDATVWILTIFVEDDASSVCGGTTGSVTADFF